MTLFVRYTNGFINHVGQIISDRAALIEPKIDNFSASLATNYISFT